jgi:hypothetical protein
MLAVTKLGGRGCNSFLRVLEGLMSMTFWTKSIQNWTMTAKKDDRETGRQMDRC